MLNLTELARAKVNLCLHITGKRADGYHLLDSLVVFPDIGDVLRVEASNDLTLSIDGPFCNGLSVTDNLVLKAAQMLRPVGRGAALTLTKNLPISSGIGGGSADAAAALRLLSRFWDVPMPRDTLPLGADVPVCVVEQTTRMQGIGEDLTPISNLPNFGIVLVNPLVSVSTAQIFAMLTQTKNPAITRPDGFATATKLFQYLADQRNDMQPAAVKIAPQIGQVLTEIQRQTECGLARMSGSGGTCFGMFSTVAQAQLAADAIARQQPNWWVVASQV